jgi:hypothetical protein
VVLLSVFCFEDVVVSVCFFVSLAAVVPSFSAFWFFQTKIQSQYVSEKKRRGWKKL